MAHVEIYSSPFCGYCMRAKALLDNKGVAYTDIDVMMDGTKREEMMKRSGGDHRVPQIFIGGEHIGGSDDLVALDKAGKLDALLQAL
ncbi:MAG: glutaredoxin 3 [Rhodospirillales bacterium]